MDLTQDTFLRLWFKRNRITTDRLRGLLFTIANGFVKDYHRRRSVRFQYLKFLERPIDYYSPEEEYALHQFQDFVYQIIQELPEKKRKVYELHRFTGVTQANIAKLMNIHIHTVEKRIQTAVEYMYKKTKKFYAAEADVLSKFY